VPIKPQFCAALTGSSAEARDMQARTSGMTSISLTKNGFIVHLGTMLSQAAEKLKLLELWKNLYSEMYVQGGKPEGSFRPSCRYDGASVTPDQERPSALR
jgi:hypothetical protein